MSRTVAALYNSRAEAETAVARLQAEAQAESVRVVDGSSPDALDRLDATPDDLDFYRRELARGGHLVVATVRSGEDPERLIRLLGQSARSAPAEERSGEPARLRGQPMDSGPRSPGGGRELRVGERLVVRGGAQVELLRRDMPAEEERALSEGRIGMAGPPVGHNLPDDEVRAAGLLKDRIIEATERQQEPVIGKQAVVREELVVSKSADERTETFSDVVRHTEVDVTEIPSSEDRRSRRDLKR